MIRELLVRIDRPHRFPYRLRNVKFIYLDKSAKMLGDLRPIRGVDLGIMPFSSPILTA